MTEKTMQARRAFLVDTLQKLLGQDSPTGFTHGVIGVAEGIARELGFATRQTNKGNLIITVPGREPGRKVGLCAHVDTLGLMVRSITADGMLMVTKVGGPLLPTLDGEYCRIYTRAGQVCTGTVLSLSPSVHVQDDAATRPRTRRTWRCASTRRCTARRTWRRWASPPGTMSATTPRPPSPKALCEIPLSGRQGQRGLPADPAVADEGDRHEAPV